MTPVTTAETGWTGPPPDAALIEGLRARVLIVDDDERNAFAATTALEELGHDIVVARSGEEALRRLLIEDYAVILLDLHMPGMDGYETAALIRQRRRTARIPIVFLTAVFRDEAHLFQAYTAGAVDVVFKPIDPFILRSKVQVLIDLHLKTIEVQLQAEHRQRLLDETARAQREKLEAELALRRSEERQQAILKLLPIAVHSRSVEPPFRPLFVSDSIRVLTGFEPEAFTDSPDLAFSRIHPEDLDQVVASVSSAVQRGFYSCEFRWLHADGEYRRFLDQGALAPSASSSGREIVGALLDVTERRSLEEQLAQARKMEAVGQLTGGVAHDFNNLLTVILGNIDLLQRRVEEDARAQRQLSAIRHAADRGRSLTRQLLAFSRRQRLSPVTLDVNDLIANFEPLLRQAVGGSATVELKLLPESLCANVDPAQLETALLNLALNARDAMPNGGAIRISTSLASKLARGPQASGREGPWVLIEAQDEGVGMADEMLEHIFEPFFTTKDVGKGSGLGLSQVYGFVQQSGGHIFVSSKPGAGTSFQLYLRRSDQAAAAPAPPAPLNIQAGEGRLLVVEDDVEVLALTVELLGGLGYQVTTATDAAGALKVLERGDPVDLLFSDVVMPGGRNGVELARLARQMRPDLKVLLTSGYVGEAVAMAGEAFELIDKPYESMALAAKLNELLQIEGATPPRRRGPAGRGRGARGAGGDRPDRPSREARLS